MKLKAQHRRHAPFYVAALAAAIVLPFALWLRPQLAVEAAANVFFLAYLVLSAIKMRQLTADFLAKHAAGADEPVWAIFAVTLGAVVVAVASLFILINSAGGPDALALGLSLASVALGWLTIHTMAAFHYAHVYWQPVAGGPGTARDRPCGGLEFPGAAEPQGYDFLYFAFVIGMTAQTSDTAITRTAMRKLALLHGIVSFLFNTVLVAAAVNVAVSVAQ
jgi:uncharacterized membrane protein